jgi:hypothetical protein
MLRKDLALFHSMADPSFPARYAATLNMLNTTSQNMFTQYSQIQAASKSLVSQSNTMQSEVQNLKAKLANVKKVSDTYDREFLDRSAVKAPFGFWQSRGVSTLQDWVFFMFFVSYAIICMCIFAVAVQKSAMAATLVLVVSIIVGIMMSLVVVMFA